MSNIELRKPSELNEFDGNFDGNEIVQVTIEGVGTYKTTTSALRKFINKDLTQEVHEQIALMEPTEITDITTII